MSSDETIQKAFEIIGEALSLEPEDFLVRGIGLLL